MLLVKTPQGQLAFKQRDARMGPRQRSVFLLCDGQRSLDQVLAATGGLGITADDVQQLQALGFLQVDPGTAPASVAPPSLGGAATEGNVVSARSDQERYSAAYPVAIALTGALGLKGFRLNLAVEAAIDVHGLEALAPKIHQAVGDAKYLALKAALFD